MLLPKSSFADIVKMSAEQRTAFAAGCAERVYLYERHAEPVRDDVWEAITRAWGRVQGKKIADGDATQLVKQLDQESSAYANEIDQTLELPFEVIVAAMRALETAHSGDPEKAEAAANFALGAVGRVDKTATDDGIAEELGWQLDWLRSCVTCDPGALKAELKRRTATEPAWFVRWTS